MNSSAAAPRKLPNSTWAEIRTAHASGIGLRELARNMGIPAGTVLARARREGWTQRREHARSLAITPAARLARTPSEAAAMSMAERGQRHFLDLVGWEKAFSVGFAPDRTFADDPLDLKSRAKAAPAVLQSLKENDTILNEVRILSERPYARYPVV